MKVIFFITITIILQYNEIMYYSYYSHIDWKSGQIVQLYGTANLELYNPELYSIINCNFRKCPKHP